MEFEVLKRSHVKRNIIIGLVAILIISAIVFNLSSARYRVTDSVPIINSEINYKVPDLNMVSLYVANEEGEYIEADIIPTSGYILNPERSYCGRSNNGEIVRDDTVSIVYENGLVNVNGISKKGTKCYLYFDETFNKIILTDNPTIDDSRSGTITDPLIDNTTGTLFIVEDNNGTSYFYAGDVDNNWVQFAGFYWRIIRINGDGSIRLIYSGDSESGPVETGESTQIGTSAFNEQASDNAYVGYMYGTSGSDTYEETHANINNSTIKKLLDEWYQQNLLNFSEYISTEAGFCNDRTPSTSSSNINNLGGIGTTQTYYGGYIRLVTNKTPTFECPDEDWYTTVESSKGNRSLTYPIGLINADEMAYAGFVWGKNNTDYYLYTGQSYWTMSPYIINASGNATIFYIYQTGERYYYVNGLYGIRPVINLDKNVSISSGDGSIDNPYIVS